MMRSRTMKVKAKLITIAAIVIVAFTIMPPHLTFHDITGNRLLEVLADSYISLIDKKALLHLRNTGDAGIVITCFEIEGIGQVEEADLGDTIGLFGNGVWIDKRTNEVGLNAGGEGYIILNLGNMTSKMTKGEVYTLLIHTKVHGTFKAYLIAKVSPILTRTLQTITITKTIQET